MNEWTNTRADVKMGAMACLMYIIKSKMDNKNHLLQRAILLSPAGYHKTVWSSSFLTLSLPHIRTDKMNIWKATKKIYCSLCLFFTSFKAPFVVQVIGPIIYLFLKLCPSFYSFRFPNGNSLYALSHSIYVFYLLLRSPTYVHFSHHTQTHIKHIKHTLSTH
jgi:hypothetical protein